MISCRLGGSGLVVLFERWVDGMSSVGRRSGKVGRAFVVGNARRGRMCRCRGHLLLRGHGRRGGVLRLAGVVSDGNGVWYVWMADWAIVL